MKRTILSTIVLSIFLFVSQAEANYFTEFQKWLSGGTERQKTLDAVEPGGQWRFLRLGVCEEDGCTTHFTDGTRFLELKVKGDAKKLGSDEFEKYMQAFERHGEEKALPILAGSPKYKSILDFLNDPKVAPILDEEEKKAKAKNKAVGTATDPLKGNVTVEQILAFLAAPESQEPTAENKTENKAEAAPKEKTAAAEPDAFADPAKAAALADTSGPAPSETAPEPAAHSTAGAHSSDPVAESEQKERPVAKDKDSILAKLGWEEDVEKSLSDSRETLEEAISKAREEFNDSPDGLDSVAKLYDALESALMDFKGDEEWARKMMGIAADKMSLEKGSKALFAKIHAVRKAPLKQLEDYVAKHDASEINTKVANAEIERRKASKLVKNYSQFAAARSNTALKEVEAARDLLEDGKEKEAAEVLARRYSQLREPVRRGLLKQIQESKKDESLLPSEKKFLDSVESSLNATNAYWEARREMDHEAAKKAVLAKLDGDADKPWVTSVVDSLGKRLDGNQDKAALLNAAFDNERSAEERAEALTDLRKVYEGYEHNVLDTMAQLDRLSKDESLSKEYRDKMKERRDQWAQVIGRQDENGKWYLPLKGEDTAVAVAEGTTLPSNKGSVLTASADDLGGMIDQLNGNGRGLEDLTVADEVAGYRDLGKPFTPPKDHTILAARKPEGDNPYTFANVKHDEALKAIKDAAAATETAAAEAPKPKAEKPRGLASATAARNKHRKTAPAQKKTQPTADEPQEAATEKAADTAETTVAQAPLSVNEQPADFNALVAKLNEMPKNVKKAYLLVSHQDCGPCKVIYPKWLEFANKQGDSDSPIATFYHKSNLYTQNMRPAYSTPDAFMKSASLGGGFPQLIEMHRQDDGRWVRYAPVKSPGQITSKINSTSQYARRLAR